MNDALATPRSRGTAIIHSKLQNLIQYRPVRVLFERVRHHQSMATATAARIVVCLNEHAGHQTGKDLSNRLREMFAARHLDADVVATVPGTSGRASLAGGDGTTLVAAGGDGTVSAVAADALRIGATLGVLPLGTLNHFAKDLGIPQDLEKAIDLIASHTTASVDVGLVNDRPFINNCSLGVYPTVVEARDQLRRRGHRKWIALVLAATRVLPRHHRLMVRLDADGEPATWRTPFVLIANNAYETAGLGFGGRKSIQGGRLYAYVAPAIRARQLPAAALTSILSGMFGRARGNGGGFEVVDAHQFWIDANGPRRVRIAVDGELSTISMPAHFRIAPSALRVIAPPRLREGR